MDTTTLNDWAYIAELAARKNVDPDVLYKEVCAQPDQRRLNMFGPLKYQLYLYALLRIYRPLVVVETGVRYGVATTLMLRALRANCAGHLYSCDPMHAGPNEAVDALRATVGYDGYERWSFFSGKSCDMLPRIAECELLWDCFVHDSDHRGPNMTWELEYAWERRTTGGLIVCDDWDWRDEFGQPYRALETFCAAHGLDFHTVSTAAVVELP